MEYTKTISRSEAYYKKSSDGRVVDNNGGGKQVSYNLPQEFINALLNAKAIEEVDGASYTRPAWRLSEKYDFILGDYLLEIIGPRYQAMGNKFLVSEGKGNTNWQMFKRMYKNMPGKNYKWFVDLYDSAVEGSELVFDLDVVKHTLTMDVEG